MLHLIAARQSGSGLLKKSFTYKFSSWTKDITSHDDVDWTKQLRILNNIADLVTPRLSLEEIIRSTGFYRNKAKSIRALGAALVEKFGGEVPRTMEELVTLPGVGRKTANVILTEAFGQQGIAVDTHVIRLTGPVWRLTDETDPVKIEFALYDLVPEQDRAFFGIAGRAHMTRPVGVWGSGR